jgi:chromosome segregation ATPase
LILNVANIKERASISVRRASENLANLTPTARKASTGGAVGNAQATLDKARKAEKAAFGREADELKSALNQSIDLFTLAYREGEDALERLERDQNEYQSYYSNVQSAIETAQKAIEAAENKVTDSDAGNAGESAYRKAVSDLPQMVAYGASLEALQRTQAAAKKAKEAAETATSQAKAHIREAERKRAEVAALIAAQRKAEEAKKVSAWDSPVSTYKPSRPSYRSPSPSPSYRSPSISRSHRPSSVSRSHRR